MGVIIRIDHRRNLSCTRSAKESSSCPIRLLLPLHRATLPSMKSKKRPNGMNASAAHILPNESDGPRQWRMEERMDIKPQKPTTIISAGKREDAREEAICRGLRTEGRTTYHSIQ